MTGELECVSVCNANVLDYYFTRPLLIPREWKGRRVFFPGTVYRDALNFPVVRFLFFDEGQWCWGKRWVELPINQDCWFAVLKIAQGAH
jgi:hypothetical protein